MRTEISPTRTTDRRASYERPWAEIQEDYDLHPDMMSGDRDELLRIKRAIAHLEEPDRRIIVLYAELGSLRRLARRLGVSRSTAHNRVRRIQAAIREEVGRL